MNTYRVEFFKLCSTNGVRISYSLRIETQRTILVEDLLAAVEAPGAQYHEDLADALVRRFGGRQTLTAMHHGVHIETERTE